MEQDKLVECNRCGGNACYEQHIDENTMTWLCMGCGFTTSTLMSKGSKVVADLNETSPELYKDLLFEDKDGRIWAPSTLTLPGKGMVFLDGSNQNTWQWAAVKAIEITEEEKKQKNFPDDQQYKMDMKNIKHFEQRDFMDACEHIGFFEI
jgi:hypothetical protein